MLTDLQPGSFANLVPVQQIVKSPPRPRVPLAIAAAAFAAVVVLAFVGVGGSSLGGSLPPGSVEVAGVPLRTGAVPSLDLSDPVVVRVLANGPAASTARLSLVFLGHQAFQSSAPLVAVGDGARTARVDLSKARFVATGHNTAEVDLVKDDAHGAAVAGNWRFVAHLTQPAWLSVEGIALILLLLFSLAYIEQFARALWRGRRQASATVGLGVFTALLAVVIVGAAWLAGAQQPTLADAVLCAALGAISGVALAVGLFRAGRWRRLRRRAARRGAAAPAGLSVPR